MIRPLRYAWLWLTMGVALLLTGAVLALLPLSVALPPRAGDKVLHLAGFAALTVWFFGVFQPHARPRVAVGLMAYGASIEVLQSFIPHRFAEGLDLIFNVVGIGAGWLMSAAGLHGWCETIESWFGADRAA